MIREKIYNLTNWDRKGMWTSRLYETVAILALPSGVITASYLEELREYRERRRKIEHC